MNKRWIIEVPIIALFLVYVIVFFMANFLIFGIVLLVILSIIGVEYGIVWYSAHSGNWRETLDQDQVQVQSLNIPVENDVILKGSLYTPFREKNRENEPLPAIIFIPGIAGSMHLRLWATIPLVKQGYAVLVYNHRGRGKSGGKRDDFVHIVQDIRKVIDYVQRRPELDPKRCAVIGHSLGGIAALTHGYNDPRVKCVIGISAPHDIKALTAEKKTFANKLIFIGLRMLGMKSKWTPEENQVISPKYFLQSVPENVFRVFLIHAKDDFVNFETQFVENVVAAEIPNTNTLLLRRGGHELRGQETLVVAQILRWVQGALGIPGDTT